MSRFKLILTSSLLAIALVVSMGIASSGATPLTARQDATDLAGENVATAVTPSITPLAGITSVSPTEPWITEVRIPAIIGNVTAETIAADLSVLDGFVLTIRDSGGVSHGLDSAHPQRAALPNHSLRYLDPAMVARWTFGFRVPTATASNLILELTDGTETVASWQVDRLGPTVPARDAALSSNATVSLAESFMWGPDVEVTATQVGSLVCGDPDIETVTQVVAVAFAVTNSGAAEVRWPGYIHRDGASIAQWSDGTAADMTVETYVGDAETLPRVSTFAVRIPAMAASNRAMVFAAPRDGRFTDTSTLPEGVTLNTSNGRIWLDLAGVEATLPMSPTFCDLGFFGGPVPFGFAPGAKFDVGGEAPLASASAMDATAQMRITEALAGAALHYDSHSQSFAGISGEDLVAVAPRLTFVGHNVGADLTGASGIVYFDTRSDDDQFIYVATRSESGRWFCAGITPHTSAIAADGLLLSEIAEVCFPETLVDEG
ncbi:MAG: hypothetical protein GY720_12890 [bacterium]|nr:hypothetical protein [bacterium]